MAGYFLGNGIMSGIKGLTANSGPQAEADRYRAALERAAYGDAGTQYGQGLGQISNYLAGAGPLADSGAATALRARLASQVYGQANSRIGQGYASYLANAMNAQRQYNYQRALLQYQKKLSKTGIGGVLGGIAGSVVGAIPGVGGVLKGLAGSRAPAYDQSGYSNYGAGYNSGGSVDDYGNVYG